MMMIERERSAGWQTRGIMQQFAVSAADIVDAIGNETARLVLAGIALPIRLVAAKAQQGFRDLAITGAVGATVEGAQDQDVPVSGLRR